VIDQQRHTIYGDMREASAEQPYRCIYAGRDVSGEVTTSPIEVGAVAFEDEKGAVRMFVCNLRDAARAVTLEFRGRTLRCRAAAGELVEIAVGTPSERDAYATPEDMRGLAAESV
jgi:hypothetical protein